MGYCCLNTQLREIGIFTSRTCRLDTIKEKGIEYSYELTKQNLNDLAVILRWNYKNKIFNYRMSSEMFPFATHADYYKTYDLEQFLPLLKKIGILAKKYNQRLTFHPGQYNQLTSKRECVIVNSVIDINFHAKVLDYIGVDENGIIIIHGGSKQDGKDLALERLENNYHKLSESAKKRLVLENCEMAYSIEDLLPLCTKLSIPIVIDYHHHNINSGSKTCSLNNLTIDVLKIWDDRKIIPLFHLSESRCGVTENDSITARRAHSDYINTLPDELLKIVKERVLYLDIEAKQKEKSVMELYKKYNIVTN